MLAAYDETRNPPWKLSTEAMFTILPLPWATMIRPASWQSSKVAVRFTSITSSQSARSWSTASAARPMPWRVDEDVEAAQPLDRLGEAAAQVVAVGEVGAHGDAAQLGGRLVRALRAAEHGHARTGVGERTRQPAPDPAAAARHERAASGQVEGTGHGVGLRAPSSARIRAVSR